ncbi:MAG: tetratricopeptide repeat protein, partial [Actinomycetota bacterium]
GTFNVAMFLPEAMRACAAAGELELGARLLEGADDRAPRHRYCLLTARAVLSEAQGELEKASAGYEEAAERWREYGQVPERAQALLGLGRCLVQMGAAAKASVALQEARDVFSELGARPLLEETDTWLAKATALSS